MASRAAPIKRSGSRRRDNDHRSLERRIGGALHRLPYGRRWHRLLLGPRARNTRIVVGCALMAGGVLGFLPVLGFWMIPLGLALLSLDVPQLRAPVRRVLVLSQRRWRRWRRHLMPRR